MPHSYYNIWIHAVFSTKERQPLITTEIENQLLYNSTISDDDIVNLLDEEAISKIKINSSIDKSELEETLLKEEIIQNYLTN